MKYFTVPGILSLLAAVLIALCPSPAAFASDEITIHYYQDEGHQVTTYADAGSALFLDKPGTFNGSSWWVQVWVENSLDRKYYSTGLIHVSGDTGDSITLYLQASRGNNTLSQYAVKRLCRSRPGFGLESDNSRSDLR